MISTEDAESIKAVCHHYMLDFLQRKGYKYILEEAEDVGLEGAYEFLKIDDEYHIQNISDENVYPAEVYLREVKEVLSKWKKVHQSKGTNISESAKEFAQIIKLLTSKLNGSKEEDNQKYYDKNSNNY